VLLKLRPVSCSHSLITSSISVQLIEELLMSALSGNVGFLLYGAQDLDEGKKYHLSEGYRYWKSC